jgi:hypothetical protein
MLRAVKSLINSKVRFGAFAAFMTSLLTLSLVSPAFAVATVSIGNGPQQVNGSYINAQNLANNLVVTSITIQASTSLTIVDPIDLSSSSLGTPKFNLSLVSPVCNISNSVIMAAQGNLFLTCNVINITGPISSGGTILASSRISSTATQVNVGPGANLQQAIDLSSTTGTPTVSVAAGQYNGNLTINHPLTLTGNDGTNPIGADPTAPTLNGTAPGGNVVTVTANGVKVDGFNIDGLVSGGASTASTHSIVADNVDSFTASHNTFTNFSGTGINTAGSTNVTLNSNAPTDQTVHFTSTAPTNAVVGGATYTPSASASSGLGPVITVDSAAANVCSINGSGVVSFQGAGTCVLDANQAGNTYYSAAPQVQQSFAVNTQGQTVSFTSTAPTNAVINGPTYTPTASTTSGLSPVITVDPTAAAVCSIDGSGVVSYQSAGTCVLDADQAGNTSYSAAPQAQQSFTVAAPTVVTVAVSGAQTYGLSNTSFGYVVNPPSGVTVSGSLSCTTVNGGTPISTALGAGAYTLDTANCSGLSLSNSVYYTLAYTSAANDFTVNKAAQTVSFSSSAPTTAVVNGPQYTPTASATSGLNPIITVDSSSSNICSIDGSGVVSFQTAGNCVLDANQAGDANYIGATQVQQSFTVAHANQTVSFTSTVPANPVAGGPTYTPTASATSGLSATITVDSSASDICSINGSGVVSFQTAGNCVLDANQAGNGAYNPATQVQQVIAVNFANQTVSFTSTAPIAAVVGGATYTPTASATSGLTPAITVDSSAASICSIDGSDVVSFQTAGTCVLDANQSGNSAYSAAAQVQQSFTVAHASQTVSFTSTALTTAVVNGSTYTPVASATSGLSAVITVDSSAATICSINGSGAVSFQAAGNCVLDANQAGNASYNAAPQVQQSFAVAHANQTVSFTSTVPANAVAGGVTYTPSASATSGLTPAITVDSSAVTVCSINGSGVVSFHTAGTCILDANQAGNASYSAAPQAQQSFGVAHASQTVSFTSSAPTNAVTNGPTYTPTASATSGLAAAITVDPSSSAVCSISSGKVSFQTAGTCVLDANQAGNTVYSAAPQAQQAFIVAAPTIVPVAVYGSQTFGSSSPSFSYVATSPSGVTVSGTLTCTTVNSGTPISASLAGGGSYRIDAASCSGVSLSDSVHYTLSYTSSANDFTVNKASQTVAFTSPVPTSAAAKGATYTPTASATSGLPVAITVDSTSSTVCTISGGIVSFQTTGTCVLDANQAGNTNYNAAARVQQSFTVAHASQTVSFTSSAPTNATVGGATYTPTASATSALTVAITVDSSSSTICSISSGKVSFQSVGTCTLDANQSGNTTYSPAAQVQQSFTVSQAPVFTVKTPPTTATVGQTYMYEFVATGTPAPTYSLAAGAPSWLSVNSTTGVVMGTPPTGTTSFTYSVNATNSAGTTTSGPFTVSVAAASTARADIAVALTCTSTGYIDAASSCSLTVTNNGPMTANNVNADLYIGGWFINASLSSGGQLYGGTAVWTVSSLASGASKTFTFSATELVRYTAAISALAYSAVPDPNLFNNVALTSV